MGLIQINAINAYRKLSEIQTMKLPATISFKIYKLNKQLASYYEWQSNAEKELFSAYNASFMDDGNLTVEDKEKLPEFAQKLNDIINLEHEDFEKVQIPISAFEMLSIEDIDCLSNVFEFVE